MAKDVQLRVGSLSISNDCHHRGAIPKCRHADAVRRIFRVLQVKKLVVRTSLFVYGSQNALVVGQKHLVV